MVGLGGALMRPIRADRFDPGEGVVVTMHIIPGEDRFEEVRFSLPADHITRGPGIEVPGQVPAMRCDPTQPDPLDPGRSQARQLAWEILAERYPTLATQPNIVDQLWTPTQGCIRYYFPTSLLTPPLGRGQATRQQLSQRARPGWRAILAGGQDGFFLLQQFTDRVACGREGPDRDRVSGAVDTFISHAEGAHTARAELITEESNREAMAGSSVGNYSEYYAFEESNMRRDPSCLFHHMGI